jgi:HNH endonuclease
MPQNSGTAKPEIEHILAIQHGGRTVAENLALSCFRCNRYKGTNVGSFDSETDGAFAGFFNPRTQIRTEHFHIGDDGEIIPLTPEARVTVRIFKFNDAERIEERRELIEAGLY